ncbi:MAG TPA: alkaline phosphatase family protein [Vicinamibacterales bacterium]|nr:alkaline phosphatase family protein [Vicinamibacterales bacterium]
MRRILVFASCLCAVAAAALETPRAAQTSAAPRLVVIVVVDQMRADYLETFRSSWRGGLKKLLGDGAYFEHAEYPYMNTVTCAGHATIGTGTFPHTHGMVLNGWYDRERKASVACTDDADARHISYGREARSGNSARLLLAPTLADEMRGQRPGTRVVTLALKPRSAIGLAGHAGTAVTWVDDAAAAFVTSRAFGDDLVPPVADFLKRDPFDADAKKTWTLRDDISSYRYPDASVGARPQQSRTGLFPHRIGGAKGTEAPFFTLWQASPFADAYLERMAESLITSFRLGQGETTDFLGVSFSALDLVGHAFGPESREIEDHLRRLDDTIGALIAVLDQKIGQGRWVLGFSSDHGVAPIAVTTGGGRITTDDVRDRIEETLITRYGPRNEKEGNYVVSVTFNYVYLAPGIFDRLKNDPATYAEVEKAVLGVPGMERLLRSDRLSDSSGDRAVRAAALSYLPARSGDIILVGKPNWYFSPRGDGAGTTHGTAHPYDRRVPVILLGHGIKAGRYAEVASPADIAPTLAHVIGVQLPKAEGRVLREALK